MKKWKLTTIVLIVLVVLIVVICNLTGAEPKRATLETGKYDVLSFPGDTSNISLNSEIDENGIPYFMENGERLYNPSNMAFQISKYESLDEVPQNPIDKSKWISDFDINNIGLDKRAINNFLFMKDYLKNLSIVYKGETHQVDLATYRYDYTYNGRTAKAPFSSAFSQVKWLQATLYLYCKAPSQETYDMVERAMAAYLIPINKGGFTYTFPDGSLWFEEIPLNPPTHILNAQILSLVTLQTAVNITGDERFKEIVEKGRKALEQRFEEYYDNGTFARYDLNYKNQEIMFRISSYTGQGDIENTSSQNQIIVNSIHPRRENTAPNKRYSLYTTNDDAFKGASRLAGDWSEIITCREKNGRAPAVKALTPFSKEDKYGLTGTGLFVVEFPSEGKGDAILEIYYFDNGPGTFTVDMRDCNAGNVYRFNPIASVTTYGDKTWKKEEIRIPLNMLSGYIGPVYQARHIQLLKWYQQIFNTDLFSDAISRYSKAYITDGDPPNSDELTPIINIANNHARVISNNMDQAPYDASKLIDDNLSTNIGSPFGQEPAYVEFQLDDVYFIKGINLVNYSDGVGPSKVEVWSSEGDTGEYQLKYAYSGDLCARDNAAFRFPVDFRSKRLKITFSDFKGQDRFIGREIEIFADPEELYADRMLKEATGTGIENKTVNYERILEITKYLSDNYKLGYVTHEPILKNYLQSKVAQCGDRVIIVRKLLGYLGVPTRTINFYNSPNTGDGHSAMEFFLYNEFHYLDPSFDFFVAKPASDGLYKQNYDAYFGVTLSYEEVKKLAGLNQEAFHILPFDDLKHDPSLVSTYGYRLYFQPWLPEMRSSSSNPYLPGYEGGIYTSEGLFKNADPSGPIAAECPMEFPVKVDPKTLEFKIGDYGELASENSAFDTDSGITPSTPAGLSYLGISLENRNQRYELPVTGLGKTWELVIVPAYISFPNMTLSIEGEGVELLSDNNISLNFTGFRKENSVIHFVFKQVGQDAKVHILHNAADVGQYVTVDAIRLRTID